MPGTEDDILKSIGEFDEPVSENTPVSEGEGEAPVVEEEEGTPDAESTAGGGADDSGTDKGQPEQGNIDASAYKYDAKGNVVDLNGKVIAKSGAERRLFESKRAYEQAAQHFHGVARKLHDENAKLREEIARNSSFSGIPQQLGLNNQEVVASLQMMANWKRDPVGVAKAMLTELQAAGHSIEGVTNAQLDMGAIARMIDSKLQPIVADRTRAQENVEVERRALEEYNAFVTDPRFQYARVHEDVLARLLQGDPRLSPEAAYFQLKSWVLENGLDFTKPLKAQYEGRMQQAPVRQSQPIPTGRTNAVPLREAQPFADADASYDEIVRQTMAEHGLKV